MSDISCMAGDVFCCTLVAVRFDLLVPAKWLVEKIGLLHQSGAPPLC